MTKTFEVRTIATLCALLSTLCTLCTLLSTLYSLLSTLYYRVATIEFSKVHDFYFPTKNFIKKRKTLMQ